MNNLIQITEKGVNAKDLYKFLGIKHRFNDWIRNAIREYELVDTKDFYYYFSKSTGGRKSKEYALSIDISKELSMVAKTKQGKKARLYFIECEKILRKSNIARLVGIETRKTLTDKIKDSGENERMHGFAYASYTKLVYKLCNIEYSKQDNFRDTLTKDQIEKVKNVETFMEPLLRMGKEYGEIKDTLEPIFKTGELK